MNNRLKNNLSLFFHFEEGIHFQYLAWGWTTFLYLGGIFLWGMYLNWGTFDFVIQDWSWITGPRLYFLKDAIIKGVLPLHMPGTSALILLTDRYLSIPDQLLSPQVFLLKFMDPAVFVLVDWLILYSVGFAGLIVFSRKYHLSPFVFTVIFLLFNFNGQLEAHLSLGNITWGGYFLFPWFVLFVLELQEQDIRWRWAIKVAGLLFIIFLQGSFHQFVWCLIFLGFLFFAFPKHFGAILMAGVFACLFSAVRIFPVMIIAGNVHQEFLGGFAGAWEMLMGFVLLRDPENIMVQGFARQFYVWEYDFYIGAIGAIFLGVFGLHQWLTKSTFSQRFLIPIAGLMLLSLGGIYEIMPFLPLPIFDGERMTTRILSLPLVFLILFAGAMFQKWIDESEPLPYQYLLLLLGLAILGSDLWTHFKMWQLTSVISIYENHVFRPYTWVQVDYVDSLYTGWLRRGFILTAASLGLGAGLAWKNPQTGFSLIRSAYVRWLKRN